MGPRALLSAAAAVVFSQLVPRLALAEGDECVPVPSATIEGEAHTFGEPAGDVLWDQTYDCSELGVISSCLTDLYITAECADDFVVPYDSTWCIEQVMVKGGYFPFHGDATSVDLVIYYDDGGLPGAAAASHPGLTPVAGLDDGNFVLEPPAPIQLGAGRYWLSVKANLPFFFSGAWYWRVRHQSTEYERVFRNPDDFFETGCTEFDLASNCGLLIYLFKPDHCFRIIGEEKEEVKCADLEVEKTASTDRVPIGERFTYFIKVTNHGPEDAVDVELLDAVPDELSIEGVRRPAGWSSSVLSDVLRATTPLLLAGECALFEIEVEARSADDRIVNTASVSSGTEDCDLENNEDDVTVRVHILSDPNVPTLSEIGIALLALLMGATLFLFASRRA